MAKYPKIKKSRALNTLLFFIYHYSAYLLPFIMEGMVLIII